MKEKIKELDFSIMDEKDISNLLESSLKLSDIELKECIELIIDKIELSEMTDDTVSKPYEIIFNDARIKQLSNELIEEYNNEF